MKSSDMDSGNDLMFVEEHIEAVRDDNGMLEQIEYMTTLPSAFKSLVGKAVKIEREEPQYVIELLGDLLGVTDYKTNKAAFWFLDTIALQVLRYKDKLDDHYRSLLISWLAGEMKLIRDKKLHREDFFKEMRELFLHVAEALPNEDRLLHWDLLVDEDSKIISKNLAFDGSATSETKHLATNKSSTELTAENGERTFREKRPLVRKDSEDYHGRSITDNSPKNLLEDCTMVSIAEDSQTDAFTNINAIDESCTLTNPNAVLNIIIETTYNMYASELRYALVYAVFVTPIHIQTYHMPHTIQTLRQIKLTDSKKDIPFHIQLRERLEKTAKNEIIISNRKKIRENNKTYTKGGQMLKDLNMEIPPTPPSSLLEEEILATNRRFILPLIESKEAARILETHMADV